VSRQVNERQIRGEMVLLIGPPIAEQQAQSSTPAGSMIEAVEALIAAEAIDHKTALKRIARLRGLSKSEAYRLLLAEKQS
jgi:16S rRNA (cytidine1402-2'-O)-methyltransferase